MRKNPTVLIVDDDSFNNSIYGKKFESIGCRVITARNGLDGIRLAKKHEPDLVLLGLMMPGLNGFEVLEGLKEDTELMHIPVIVMTGLSHESDIRKCQDLGCAAYLIKSQVKPEEVMKKVKSLLGKKVYDA